MGKCPACETGLTNADLRFGRCPKCGALLNSDAGQQFQDNEVFAAEEFDAALDSIAELSPEEIQSLVEVNEAALKSISSMSSSMMESLAELPEAAAEALSDSPDQSMTIIRGLSSDEGPSEDASAEMEGRSTASRDTSDIDQTIVGDDDMSEKTRTFASMPQEIIDLLAKLPPSSIEVLKQVPLATLKSLASRSESTRKQLASLPPSKLRELAEAADESVVDGGADTVTAIPKIPPKPDYSNVAAEETQQEMPAMRLTDTENADEDGLGTVSDIDADDAGLTTDAQIEFQRGVEAVGEVRPVGPEDATLPEISESFMQQLESGAFDDDDGATVALPDAEADDDSLDDDSLDDGSMEGDSSILQTMLSDEIDSLEGISEGGSLHDEDSLGVSDSVRDDDSISEGDSSFDQTINDVAELASAAADFGEPEDVELHQPKTKDRYVDDTIHGQEEPQDSEEENAQTLAMEEGVQVPEGDGAIDQTLMLEDGIAPPEGDDIGQTLQMDEEDSAFGDSNDQTMMLDDDDDDSIANTISDEFESDSNARTQMSDLDSDSVIGKTMPSDEIEAADDDNLKTMVEDDSIEATISDFEGGSSIDQTMISDESDGSNIATMVSDELSEEEMKTVNEVWPGAISNDTQPGMTIKTDGDLPKDMPKTSLVIKRRRFSEQQGSEDAEYHLLTKLGEGGMGVVWEANQTAIDRGVAIKMLKPNIKGKKGEQQKFLAEAVVTGELDHPNIVPIYDLGHDQKGSLFYSMKKVEGTPWLNVIREKSFQENVEILMKVADAMAFAHDRGVIHRDLKPENIMLGSFGEVLVMDWGLAQPTETFRKRGTVKIGKSMGGTPAYMAPEMATGPITKIGAHSDIYLLGAILFEMITGKPPHTGKNTTQCLFAAIKNTIRPTNKSGELLDIALKAMATNPTERYTTVLDFQNAIREYQAHSESIALSTRAADDLDEAKKTDDYQDYARARFGFQEAYELWDGNETAKQGVALASHAYAESAMRKGDLDLATTLLDKSEPTHQELLQKIKAAIAEREQQKVELAQKEQRLKLFRKIGAGMAAAIIGIMAVAVVWINDARQEAILAQEKQEVARVAAVKAKNEAVVAKVAAEKAADAEKKAKNEAVVAKVAAEKAADAEKKAKDEAVVAKVAAEKAADAEKKAKDEAVVAKVAAEKARDAEQKAKEAEEYEAYIARIGLAAAKIDENAFDSALTLLMQCKPKHRNWEWGRLMYLCSQSDRTVEQESKINALALDRQGKRFVTGGEDGVVEVWGVDEMLKEPLFQLDHDKSVVNAVAFSPDGKLIATGSNDANGFIKLWNAKTGELVKKLLRHQTTIVNPVTGQSESKTIGHSHDVLSVEFSNDGKRLLTAGRDKLALLWDINSGKVISTFAGHTFWVWSASFSPDNKRIVTAGQDGIAIVWSDDTADSTALWTNSSNVKASPPFTGHNGPIFSAAFSADGKYVATGGDDRRVLVWQPEDIKPLRFENVSRDLPVTQPVKFIALEGHKASVRSVSFFTRGNLNTDVQAGGQVLVLSGGHDNTVKVWDLQTAKEITTFRGHDSWVRAVEFAPDGKSVFSASHDNKVKRWSVNEYEEIRVLQGRSLTGHADAVLSAQFSKDGKSIVTASQDRTAKRWDFGSGQNEVTYTEGHEFLTSGAAFLAGGSKLMTSAVDNTIRIWDVSRGTELSRFEGTGRGAIFAISADEKWLITGDVRDASKTEAPWYAQLWNMETQKVVRKFGGHRMEVSAVAISKDQKFIATGDSAGNCKLWETATGKLIKELKPSSKYLRRAHERKINTIAFLPDGKSLITSSDDYTAVRWSIESGRDIATYKHPNALTAMLITADGKSMVTTWLNGGLRVWDLDTNKDTVLSKNGNYNAISLAADDKTLLAVNRSFGPNLDARGKIDLFDIDQMQAIKGATAFLDFNELGGRVWSATFAPDGQTVVTVGGEDARLWSRTEQNTAALVTFKPHKAVAAASFSPDGRWVVTGSWDTSARVWDAASGKAVQKLEGHLSYVNSVVFSPDGQWILTSSNDCTAKLWKFDRASKKADAVSTFIGHTNRVLQANFSDDGKFVLTASSDSTARVWKIDVKSREIKTAACVLGGDKGHSLPVLCAAFSKNMDFVVTGSEDSFAKLWQLAPKQGAAGQFTADVVLELRGHTASITSVAFDPQGSRVLTGSEDYFVKLWDTKIPASLEAAGEDVNEEEPAAVAENVTEDGVPLAKEILSLTRHTREVTSVAFSPTGRYILTGSRDGTAILWLARSWEEKVQTSQLQRQPIRADSITSLGQLAN